MPIKALGSRAVIWFLSSALLKVKIQETSFDGANSFLRLDKELNAASPTKEMRFWDNKSSVNASNSHRKLVKIK
jgi:hypothetical protein